MYVHSNYYHNWTRLLSENSLRLAAPSSLNIHKEVILDPFSEIKSFMIYSHCPNTPWAVHIFSNGGWWISDRIVFCLASILCSTTLQKEHPLFVCVSPQCSLSSVGIPMFALSSLDSLISLPSFQLVIRHSNFKRQPGCSREGFTTQPIVI